MNEMIMGRPVSEVEAVGLSARYIRKLPAKYEVTRGKSSVMWHAVIMLVIAAVIVAVSARWMPSHSVENSFFTPLLLLPRLAAIVLVYMAFVRIKKTARHKPLMIFSETGIRVEDTEYSWISISALHFSEGTNVARDHPSLIITTSEGVKIKVNLHNIDEFPEDVAVTANRYFKKFGAKRAL